MQNKKKIKNKDEAVVDKIFYDYYLSYICPKCGAPCKTAWLRETPQPVVIECFNCHSTIAITIEE